MDTASEEKLAKVHPLLASRVRQVADKLASAAGKIEVTYGLRTWDEQAALYAQGRTTPGKIVTRAPAGSSYHNYGLACDLCPLDYHDRPDWNIDHPVWKLIVSTAQSVGLFSGSSFTTIKDWPHVQYTGRFPASPNDEVKRLYQSGGLEAVWSAL